MLWDLPFELWLACWLYCSKRQLRRLSLVSTLFRSICLPLLIEEQSVDIAALDSGLAPRNWIERTHSLHRMAVRLDRFAAQGPRGLASAVRSWRITRVPSSALRIPAGSGAPDVVIDLRRDLAHVVHLCVFDALRDRVTTTFLATLGMYENLRCLHVSGMTFDLTWRERLLSLSNLQELTLDGCEILPRDGAVLRLRRFTLSQSRATGVAPAEELLHIVDPSTLTHLNLLCAGQTRNRLAGFGGASFPSLLSLSLRNVCARTTPSLLSRCPKLQSLAVLSSTLDGPLELPGYIAPALSTLIAELALVPLFAVDHQIHTLTIPTTRSHQFSIDAFRATLSALGPAAGHLTSLTFPATRSTTDVLEVISAALPQLKHLAMDLPEQDATRMPVFRNVCRDPDSGEDTRRPEVDDDERAFEGLPPDELSDSESEGNRPHHLVAGRKPALWSSNSWKFGQPHPSEVVDPLPDSPSGTYTDLLRRIAFDLVNFPGGLESLKFTPLDVPERGKRHRCYDAQEESAVAALFSRGLRKVKIGDRVWTCTPNGCIH